MGAGAAMTVRDVTAVSGRFPVGRVPTERVPVDRVPVDRVPVDRVEAERVIAEVMAVVESLTRVANAVAAQQLAAIGLLGALTAAAPHVMVPMATGEPVTDQVLDYAQRALTADLAGVTGVAAGTAAGTLHLAQDLTGRLPELLEAMFDGRLGPRHAAQVVRHAHDLPEAALAELQSGVLAALEANPTPAALGRVARRIRERVHPEPLAARHRRASLERHVTLEPAADGMAWLTAFLPAVQACAIYDTLTTTAERLTDLPDDEPRELRTLAQRRADVLTSLLLDPTDVPPDGPQSPAWTVPAGLRGIRPVVAVTVPVLTLLGHSDEPGHLDGYGPIDPDTARELAAHAPSFIRLLTHPETGATLSVGRTRYTVPADLRTALRLRDETCRYPGCPRTAHRCDLDHTIAYRENGSVGHTSADNLTHLCRTHHRLKHTTRWTTTQHPDGTLQWTSPTGRTRTTRPAAALTGSHAPPGPPPR